MAMYNLKIIKYTFKPPPIDMQFEDIEMTESYGLRDSSYSLKNSSQANPYAEQQKSPRYSCYECGGDSTRSASCRTCQGLREVKDNNVLVGLLMQVMCCKLGREVPALRNFPKLEFSSQNRLGKNMRVRFDNKIKVRSRATTQSQNARRPQRSAQPYSQGNSINDSNSLDSSLDSIQSSSQSSKILTKQKLQRNKSARQLYTNQPHFRQQFSQIKEESYATEDYAVCCEVCQRDWDACAEFMECRVCKYFICGKCYGEKVEEMRVGRDRGLGQGVFSDQSPQMKKEKSSTGTPTSILQPLSTKNKSCEYPDPPPVPEIVTYDNNFKIHEHPLTRYCHPHEQSDGQIEDQDRVREDRDDDVYETYGQAIKEGRKKGDDARGSASYRNLFKVYDANHNECPQSPKRSPQYLNIEVIRQQRESPSPSQKSSQPLLQNESEFEHNISMTISNNYQSPESAKVMGQGLGNGSPAGSNGNSPVNIKLFCSDDIRDSVRESYEMRVDRVEEDGEGEGRNLRVQDKNRLIKQVKINRDTSEWSWYSGLHEQSNAQSQNPATKPDSQSNREIMQQQDQSESRIIESPEPHSDAHRQKQDSKSVKSSKESYIDKELDAEAEEMRREKEKSYTQKKVNNFAEVRVGGQERRGRSDRREAKDEKEDEGDGFGKDSIDFGITIPKNLFFDDAQTGQKIDLIPQKQNTPIHDPYPLLITYTTPNQSPPKHPQPHIDRKHCNSCHKPILDRSMFMNCETCEKLGQASYELCDKCYDMRDVIERHSVGGRHVFRPHLYRIAGSGMGMGMGMGDFMDEEIGDAGQGEECREVKDDKLLVPGSGTKSVLMESANSVSIEPLKPASPPKQEAPLTSPQSSPDEVHPDQSPFESESSYLQRRRKQNQLYLRNRQKKCQQNEHLMKLYDSLILDALLISNRQSVDQLPGRGEDGQGDRESENVGVGGGWLVDGGESLGLHTSVTCIPVEGERVSNRSKTSAPFNVFAGQQKQSLQMPPQSSIHINITTDNTITSTDKPTTKQPHNTSIKLTPPPHPASLAPAPESPSRISMSHKSGSPDKSEMSSRIKVDCGDSESQFQLHDICRPDDGMLGLGASEDPERKLTKSINVSKREGTNILGKSYAASEPDEEQAEDYKQPVEEEMNRVNYKIITHQINQEEKKQYYTTWDPRIKPQERESKGSRSGSDEKGKKKEKHGKDAIIMDFLGQIEKSEKLSKSDHSSQGKKEIKQGVHFDSEQPRPKIFPSDRQIESQPEEPLPEPFTFSDYNCDMCGESPTTFRYHCKKCPDYDLCPECYNSASRHQHRRGDFQKIGKKRELQLMEQERNTREEERSSLLKTIIGKYAPQGVGIAALGVSIGRASLPNQQQQTNSMTNRNNEPMIWRMTQSVHPLLKPKPATMGKSTNL